MTVTLSNEKMEELGTDPYIFNNSGAVSFADNGGDKESLELTLYDGSVVPHWYWGNLAFELSTMKMAKKRSPILYSHDVDQRIGFSTGEAFDSKFIMNGKFLKDSEIATKIKKEMEQGFQFEASLRFDPTRSNVEIIKEGESVDANGHKLKGPGAFIRNAVIMEGSVCVFGALKNTASKAFQLAKFVNDFSERLNMDNKKMTIEQFKADYAGLYEQVFAAGKDEGLAESKKNFAGLQKVCGSDSVLLVECFTQGLDTSAAQGKKIEKLEAANAELASKLSQNKPGSESQIEAGKPKTDPAHTEFSDQGSEPGKGADDKFNEADATDEELKEHFNKTKTLQNEFGEADYYVNFIKQSRKGRVKILNSK